VRAGYDVLTRNPMVDAKRIAAIGYCFGGTAVLELAFSGADVAGVVSFHGGLIPPKPADLPNVKAKLLILHGADDPTMTQQQIADFQNALRQGKLDWQMIYYSGAVHAFTNPNASKLGLKGIGYNEKADHRSWAHMRLFLDELFGPSKAGGKKVGDK
jgi:dienelactone hydrolase